MALPAYARPFLVGVRVQRTLCVPSPITTSIACARLLRTLTSTCWPVAVRRTLIFSGAYTLGGEAGAQHRRDDVGRIRCREELALADAAAGGAGGLAPRGRFHAPRPPLRGPAPRGRDQRPCGAGRL